MSTPAYPGGLIPSGGVILLGMNPSGVLQEVAVDASGNLIQSGGGASGTVAQGAAGATAWPVADSNSVAVQGVVPITPGTATTPLRGIAFYCTAAGNITLTLADNSTMTFPIAASPILQTIGFAVGNIALGTGTAGMFWGTK